MAALMPAQFQVQQDLDVLASRIAEERQCFGGTWRHVVIWKDDRGLHVESEHMIAYYYNYFVNLFFTLFRNHDAIANLGAIQEKNRQTTNFLFGLCHPRRFLQFRQVLDMSHIHARHGSHNSWSLDDVQKLFTGIACVSQDDLLSALDFIKTGSEEAATNYGLVKEELDALKAHFETIEQLSECDTRQMNLLWRVACPFTSLDVMLCGRKQDMGVSRSDGGSTPETVKAIASAILFTKENADDDRYRPDEINFALSKTLDYYTREGIVIKDGNGGYFRVMKRISIEGSHVILLVPLHKREDNKPTLIFLGTQLGKKVDGREGPDEITSCFDNLDRTIGRGAVKLLADHHDRFASERDREEFERNSLRYLLLNPELGFVQDASERVRVMGFSKGGAEATAIATALAGSDRLDALEVASPVGTSQEMVDELADRIRRACSNVPSICVSIVKGDIVSTFGDAFAGHGLEPKDAKVTVNFHTPAAPGTIEHVEGVIRRPGVHGSPLAISLLFLASLVAEHASTGMDGVRIVTVTNEKGAEETSRALSNENTLANRWRNFIAELLNPDEDIPIRDDPLFAPF